MRGKSGVMIIVLLAAVLFSGCEEDPKANVVKKLKTLESKENLTEERLAELSEAVEIYGSLIDEEIKETRHLGEYYKMLALGYMDLGMFGPALDNLKDALYIDTRNEVLNYNAGICAGQLSKAFSNASEKNAFLKEAEDNYLRAIDLRPEYNDVLYALSVLYVFEMGKVLEAERYIKKLSDINPGNMEALFLLAHVYVYKGDIQRAVELYERIELKTSSEEQKAAARRNRDALLGGGGG